MLLVCLLYADDIILLSPSVAGLQTTLHKRSGVACTLSKQFNVNKSHCIVVGQSYNVDITPVSLCGTQLNGVNQLNILCAMLNGKSVKFNC